uniref:Peptidase S1 domain-containing protein n=1 Tax=Plectus sambesii TaxID=2011161 RepID=A0A914W3P5_9BILA
MEMSCGRSSAQQNDISQYGTYRHPQRQGAVPTKRIIGGSKTHAKAWPWMAYLIIMTYSQSELRCGATIVSDRWLITAAHCLTDFWNGTVLVGFKDVHDWYTQESYLIESTTVHPGYYAYDKMMHNHDIALIKAVRDIKFNEYVQPICLSANDSHFSKNYHFGHVTGWGYHSKPIPHDSESEHNTTQSEEHYVVHGFSDKLLVARIPFIDYDKCRSYWKLVGVGDGQICAGAFQKGTSMGDSGGPLQVHGIDGRWYLVGITSFGEESSDETALDQDKNPGVYTRVSYYCDFIAKETEGTLTCDTGSTASGTLVSCFVVLLSLMSHYYRAF